MCVKLERNYCVNPALKVSNKQQWEIQADPKCLCAATRYIFKLVYNVFLIYFVSTFENIYAAL